MLKDIESEEMKKSSSIEAQK